MRNFKTAFFLNVLVVLSLVAFIGCSRMDEKSEINIPSNQTLQLISSSEGSSQTLHFSSNTSWSVSVTQNPNSESSGWITVSPLSGKAGNVELIVITSENTLEMERSAVIKIEAGEAHQSFTLVQDAFLPLLTFPEPSSGGNDIAFKTSGGNSVFSFAVNTSWTISAIDASTGKEPGWLAITPLSGNAGSVQLNINAVENTSGQERVATLTFSAGSVKKTISVKQAFNIGLPMVDISSSVQRISDMQVKRLSHVLIVNGNDDYTALGGHTDGFTLTNTAERFSNSSWKFLSSNYPHDMGFVSKLKDGTMLIGGGCSSGWGVGQSSSAEVYDPSSYSFTAVGNMTVDRCNAHSATLSDGRVLVAGNWYNSASVVDIYNPKTKTFSSVYSSIDLSSPFVLSDSNGGALIFGRYTSYGSYLSGSKQVFKFNPATSTITDFQCDLFADWYPLAPDQDAVFDRDGQGRYILLSTNGKASETEVEYELMAVDPLTSTFSLLKTEYPIPVFVPNTSVRIGWSAKVIVNSSRNEVYLIGETGDTDTSITCYILSINYLNNNMQLSYFGGLSHIIIGAIWKLLPNGKLIASGGSSNGNSYNFFPDSKTYIIKPF